MTPEPVEAPPFVGRGDLLKRFYHEWENFIGKKHTYSGFFLYAIAGMGKTWLLRTFYSLIVATCRQAIWLRILDRGQPPPPLPAPQLELLALIGQRASEPCDPQAHPLQRLNLRDGLAKVGERLGIGHVWHDLLPALEQYDLELQMPTDLLPDQPILICLDGIDLLERYTPAPGGPPLAPGTANLWENLQEHWLRPLMKDEQLPCFVLLAGQGQPSWYSWDLGRLIQPERLEQLRAPEIKQLLRHRGLADNARIVEKLSSGHADLVNQCVYEMKKRLPNIETTLQSEVDISSYKHPDVIHAMLDIDDDQLAILRAIAPARIVHIDNICFLARVAADTAADFLRSANAAGIVYRMIYSHTRRPSFRMRSDVQSAVLRYRLDHDLPTLAVQYTDLAARCRAQVLEDPLRNAQKFIEWLYVCLQFQFLFQGSVQETTRRDWIATFNLLFESTPTDDIIPLIYDDPAVMTLVWSLGYHDQLQRLLSVFDARQITPELYTRLDKFIQQRLPGALSGEDWAILRDLALSDRPFKVKDIQDLLSRTRHNMVTRAAAHDKVTHLAEIYAILKDPVQGYVVDAWLGDYLRHQAEFVSPTNPEGSR